MRQLITYLMALIAFPILGQTGNDVLMGPDYSADSERQDPFLHIPQIIPFVSHTGKITRLVESPDKDFFASASEDNTIILWSVADLKPIRQFMKHTTAVTDLHFSKDGTHLFSVSLDMHLIKWNCKTGQIVYNVNIYSPILSFSLDIKEEAAILGTATGYRKINLKTQPKSINRSLQRKFYKFYHGGVMDNYVWQLKDGWVVKYAHTPMNNSGRPWKRGHFFSFYLVTKARNVNTKSRSKIKKGVTVLANSDSLVAIANGCDISFWDLKKRYALHSSCPDTSEINSMDISAVSKLLVLTTKKGNLFVSPLDSPFVHKKAPLGLKVGQVILVNEGKEVIVSAGSGLIKYRASDMAPLGLFSVEVGRLNQVRKVQFSGDDRYLGIMSGEQIVIWDGYQGKMKSTLTTNPKALWDDFQFYGDTSLLMAASSDSVMFNFDYHKGPVENLFSQGRALKLAIAPKNTHIARVLQEGFTSTVELSDSNSFQLFSSILGEKPVSDVLFSEDGKYLIATHPASGLLLWQINTGRLRRKLFGHYMTKIIVDKSSRNVISVSVNKAKTTSRIFFYDVKINKLIKRITVEGEITAITCNQNTLFYTTRQFGLHQLNLLGQKSELLAADLTFNSLLTQSNGRWLYGCTDDGTIHIWDIQRMKHVLNLVFLFNRGFVAYTPQGLFELNDFDNVESFNWFFPARPTEVWPLEVATRDYYTPNLIKSIISDENIPPVHPLAVEELITPTVYITSVNYYQGDSVDVDVMVYNLSKSSIHDVRVMRNGMLIAQWPNVSSYHPFDSSRSELENWRSRTFVSNDNTWGKNFRMRIPKDSGAMEFSAYAFNRHRIKSETKRAVKSWDFQATNDSSTVFLLSIGIGNHKMQKLQLWKAPSSAYLLSEGLSKELKRAGYRVKVINMISKHPLEEWGNISLPTKKNISTILANFSGRRDSAEDNEESVKFPTISPSDFLIIFYVGHGLETSGEFHLVPYDAIIKEFGLANTISSSELSEWLIEINARKIFLIIDACYSATELSEKVFKPAPLGNKGLGQISYDKGVTILTSSEEKASGNSILVNSLLDRGIFKKMAFYKQSISFQELLNFVRSDVTNNSNQKPVLFDFTKRRENVKEIILHDR